MIGFVLFILSTFSFVSYAQLVGSNAIGSTLSNKAILDIKSTAKGFLAPRITPTQRNILTISYLSKLTRKSPNPFPYTGEVFICEREVKDFYTKDDEAIAMSIVSDYYSRVSQTIGKK